MKLPGVSATILLLAANCAGAPAPNRVTAAEARAAVDKYIPLLEGTLQTFTCAGACHHRLGLMVYGLARERNVAVHEDLFSEVIARMEEQRRGLLEATLQGIGEPEPGMVGYYTLTARAAGHSEPSGPVFAWWIASRQKTDGRWRMLTHRPPMQDSDFTATALSIHLLKTEMPGGRAETTERVERARTWLLSSVPESTEDEAFRLLGLRWAGAAGVDPQNGTGRLISEQRPDGGWGQFEQSASDAYATGLALYALREGARLPLEHAAYQRGLRFLLKTQLPEGSWLVPTRHHPPTPGIPYVETGFPHRESQFISCAGSNWAAMALLSLLPKVRNIKAIAPKGPDLPAWADTVLFRSVAELRGLLDAGLDPNATTREGTTPLMLSVNDSGKVRLLLERGANLNAKAASGATALLVAAGFTGNMEAFRLLLDAGADVNATAANGGTVLGAALTGEPEKLALLLAKWADPNRRFVHGGVAPMYPLQLAASAGDKGMVELLVSHGASLNQHLSFGFGALPPLSHAVKNGDLGMVKLLIAMGANVNQADDLGMRPLLWSAISDYGRVEIAQTLLNAGADPAARDKNQATALELAGKFHLIPVERVLFQSQKASKR